MLDLNLIDLNLKPIFFTDIGDEIKRCIDTIHALNLKKNDISKSWDIRMKAVIGSWEGKREELFQITLRQQARRSGMCYRCHEKRALIVCNDCTKEKNLCIFCDKMVHKVHPLHDRKAWHDGAHVSLLPTESVDETGEIREGSKYQ